MLQNPELHYLDNAATTIVAPDVADVIDRAMREHWANPSSLYAPGARSEEALNAARAVVARSLGCKSRELYFTSCGSEGNNMALLGAALTRKFGKGIVVSGFEHPSVQKPLERLAAMGYDVTVVAPRPDGTLDIDEMLSHVDRNTILVACMRALAFLIAWSALRFIRFHFSLKLKLLPPSFCGGEENLHKNHHAALCTYTMLL